MPMSNFDKILPCCKIGESQNSVITYISYVNKFLSPLFSMPIFKMIWQEMFKNYGHIHVYSTGEGPGTPFMIGQAVSETIAVSNLAIKYVKTIMPKSRLKGANQIPSKHTSSVNLVI